MARPGRGVTVLYADAGALVGAYLADDSEHPTLRAALLEGADPVVSSEVVRVEVAAAFADRPRSRELLARFDADCGAGGPLLLLRLVAERTFAAAAELARAHGLGPLGAIHVVTALAIAAPLAAPEPLVFVTRDERRREAAEAFGLPTPGQAGSGPAAT